MIAKNPGDWILKEPQRLMTLQDYEGATPRWCSGCGDHPVLNAVQKVCRDERLPPEKTVTVSGIGCSSRFPHYMRTYGFHGLHGRAFPVACGIRSRRPDLNIFVATGDGDCCAIGTAHWIHAVRYNMKMVVLLLDNNIYGLTKKQTSPTTPKGGHSNTHPFGALIDPLDPISVTLGITNVSFVAQTADWLPAHLHRTVEAAFHHPGFAFVRVLQRCPHFTPYAFDACQKDPSLLKLMYHDKGIPVDSGIRRLLTNKVEHDPSDLEQARKFAALRDEHPVGLFYRNENAGRYDLGTVEGMHMKPEEKLAALEKEMSKYTV